MDYQLKTDKVIQFAGAYLTTRANDTILYHDFEHTEHVAAAGLQLAKHYELAEEDTFIIITACWFHDVGYYNGVAQGHELRSAAMATDFLANDEVPQGIIDAVRDCILATRMPQQPHTLLEQIVCDADLSHLATDDFFKRNKLLRKETEAASNKKITKANWRKSTLEFLEAYHFHTDYSKNILEAGKQKNIEKLKKQIEEDDKETLKEKKTPEITLPGEVVVIEEKQKKEKKEKSNRPERGVETMFRISSSNHQRLSDMADNKAHIMITTTSIIMSVVLSVLLRKLEDNAYLTIPVMLLLVVCVVTMVFCILATRPSIPHGTFTQEDLDTKRVNLLFFGNFYRMSLDEYAAGVKKMMEDSEFLYGSLTRDVYAQGVVLGKKYNLLRIGYSVFMFGIITSVLAFIIATVFFRNG